MCCQSEHHLWLFIVEAPHCGSGWTGGLSRFPGERSLCLCSGGWSCISSLWSAVKCPVVSSEMFMGLVWLWAACALKLRAVPALLENWPSVSCSGACWPLGGAWFQCRYGGFWVSSYQLMFSGVRSSLVFSGLGLKPPASGFQSYSYSSLKAFSSIQHQW